MDPLPPSRGRRRSATYTPSLGTARSTRSSVPSLWTSLPKTSTSTPRATLTCRAARCPSRGGALARRTRSARGREVHVPAAHVCQLHQPRAVRHSSIVTAQREWATRRERMLCTRTCVECVCSLVNRHGEDLAVP